MRRATLGTIAHLLAILVILEDQPQQRRQRQDAEDEQQRQDGDGVPWTVVVSVSRSDLAHIAVEGGTLVRKLIVHVAEDDVGNGFVHVAEGGLVERDVCVESGVVESAVDGFVDVREEVLVECLGDGLLDRFVEVRDEIVVDVAPDGLIDGIIDVC